MLDQFNTDLSNIFEEEIFTEVFTHTYGEETEDINALFDEAYVEILRGIESSLPAITMLQADMDNVTMASTFTRQSDSTVYKVKRINPEDSGLRVIVLTKDSK